MVLSKLEYTLRVPFCFGDLAGNNYSYDAILWYQQDSTQAYIVFDNWLQDKSIARQVPHDRLYHKIVKNIRLGSLKMLSNMVGLYDSLTQEERELYLADIEMPWDSWPLLLPAPEENRRIDFDDISTDSGWLVRAQVKR